MRGKNFAEIEARRQEEQSCLLLMQRLTKEASSRDDEHDVQQGQGTHCRVNSDSGIKFYLTSTPFAEILSESGPAQESRHNILCSECK